MIKFPENISGIEFLCIESILSLVPLSKKMANTFVSRQPEAFANGSGPTWAPFSISGACAPSPPPPPENSALIRNLDGPERPQK